MRGYNCFLVKVAHLYRKIMKYSFDAGLAVSYHGTQSKSLCLQRVACILIFSYGLCSYLHTIHVHAPVRITHYKKARGASKEYTIYYGYHFARRSNNGWYLVSTQFFTYPIY